MYPLELARASHWVDPVVHFGIGIAFGTVLERAGFGSAKKLTNQFYLNDMSVLKVMFTGIITAAVLISVSVTFGILDFEKLWVNPTYLGSGIVGGMIFGVGFVVGGYCPGTALVAAANLKVDALLFALGVLGGIFGFGFTVPWVDQFWQESGNWGRFTLADWLGLPLPLVVLLVVTLALLFFAGGEWVERWMAAAVTFPRRTSRWRRVSVLVIFLVALVPTLAWSRTSIRRTNSREARVTSAVLREIPAVSAAELAELLRERRMDLALFDLRNEAEFNRFHLRDAERIPVGDWSIPLSAPPNQVKILIASDDGAAKATYVSLQSRRVENLYWLDGGMGGWLHLFGLRPNALDQFTVSDLHTVSRPPAVGANVARYVAKVHPPGGGAKKKGGGCGG